MEFKTNTKPLSEALSLGVINQNITNNDLPSVIAKVILRSDNMEIDLQAANVVSKIVVPGMGSEDSEDSIFVDNLLLKQLVNTLDTTSVDLEIREDGLLIRSGKSKFVLPKMLDEEIEMKQIVPFTGSEEKFDLKEENWKFISDHQMYCIAMNYIHPAYTMVYMNELGDVLVGDYDNSIFTHSLKGVLPETCLLSSTIVNLITSLPEGSKYIKVGDSYVVQVSSEGYEFTAQFSPRHESDPDLGSYNADIILNVMPRDDEHCIKVDPQFINKFMSQADLLSESKTESTIQMKYESGRLLLLGKNIDCNLEVDSTIESDFTVEFKASSLKSVLSSYRDAEVISLMPLYRDSDVIGASIWSDDFTTSISGVEE